MSWMSQFFTQIHCVSIKLRIFSIFLSLLRFQLARLAWFKIAIKFGLDSFARWKICELASWARFRLLLNPFYGGNQCLRAKDAAANLFVLRATMGRISEVIKSSIKLVKRMEKKTVNHWCCCKNRVLILFRNNKGRKNQTEGRKE